MKALVAWSSGKDSAWALHEARRSGNFEMVGALTTVTDAFGRVSMHGIREELLRAQLEAAGLPAFVLYIPFPCPNEVYEQKMSAALEDARAFGSGLEAHLSTVDLKKLPGSFAGRKFDGSLLASLPAGVDPCGENGEFHSFVSAGPMFSRDLTIRVGDTIERDGFAYADLLLA